MSARLAPALPHAASWLLVGLLAGLLPLCGSQASYRLGLVGTGGPCHDVTSWAASCHTYSDRGIPAVTVGLFTSSGAPCCGHDRVSVHVKLFKGDREVALEGYRDRDSAVGEDGSAMQVTFSGLSPADPSETGHLNLTFSAFYEGTVLSITSNFFLYPDSLALMPPWGDWGAPQTVMKDSGPWTVHAPLPAFHVALVALNDTQVHSLESDRLRVGARLFARNGADITAASLVGTTIQTAIDGVAIFEGLSVGGVAGVGLNVVFYVLGSDKLCDPGVPRASCYAWENHRDAQGGLGGYWVELASPEVPVVPDLLRLAVTGPSSETDPVVRVDDFLPNYRVDLFDSTAPGAPLATFEAADNFTVSVTLLDAEDNDVTVDALAQPVRLTMTGATVPIVGGAATFNAMRVVHRAGAAFRLKFTPSWYPRCVEKLVDPQCTGACCLFSPRFSVYAHATRVVPAAASELLDGGGAQQAFDVEFLDAAGDLLSGIALADGLVVQAYLLQRGRYIYSALQGRTRVAVDAGVALFTDLSVAGHSGAAMALRFDEVGSGLSAQTLAFSVYPLDFGALPAVDRAQASAPIRDVDVRLLGAGDELMTSVSTADAFLVEVVAEKRTADGGWEACAACLAEDDGSPLQIAADGGVAHFPQTVLAVKGSFGLFRLVFTLPRGDDFDALVARTNEFLVDPATLVIVEGDAPELQSEVVGVPFGDLGVSLGDFNGAPLGEVSAAQEIYINLRLLQHGEELGAGALDGETEVLIENGVATFSGVSAAGVAGTGFQLEFWMQVPGEVVTLRTAAFEIDAQSVHVPDVAYAAVAGALIPAFNATLVDADGIPLESVGEADGWEVPPPSLCMKPLHEASIVFMGRLSASGRHGRLCRPPARRALKPHLPPLVRRSRLRSQPSLETALHTTAGNGNAGICAKIPPRTRNFSDLTIGPTSLRCCAARGDSPCAGGARSSRISASTVPPLLPSPPFPNFPLRPSAPAFVRISSRFGDGCQRKRSLLTHPLTAPAPLRGRRLRVEDFQTRCLPRRVLGACFPERGGGAPQPPLRAPALGATRLWASRPPALTRARTAGGQADEAPESLGRPSARGALRCRPLRPPHSARCAALRSLRPLSGSVRVSFLRLLPGGGRGAASVSESLGDWTLCQGREHVRFCAQASWAPLCTSRTRCSPSSRRSTTTSRCAPPSRLRVNTGQT